MRFGLAAKLSLLAAGLVFLTTLAANTLFYRGARSVVRGREAAGLRDGAELRRGELLADLDRGPADLLALAGSPAARRVFADGTPDAEARRRLDEVAVRLLDARPHYLELAVVAADDLREIVRADRTPDGARAVPTMSLRSWQGRPDLALTRGLAPSAVGYSDVRGGGPEHDRTLEQVLAAPIAGPDGRAAGWLFLRLDFAGVTRRLNQSPRRIAFLVTADGRYLAHPDPARILGGRESTPLDAAFARLAERTADAPHPTGYDEVDDLTLPGLAVYATAARFAAPPDPAKLRQARQTIVRKYAGLRAGAGDEPTTQFAGIPRLHLRAGDPATLVQALQDFRSLVDVPVEWDEPYKCETYLARLVPIRADASPVWPAGSSSPPPPWFGLALAAAHEEVEHDIAADYYRNNWLSAVLAAVAGGGMVLFTVFLTGSLRRMTAYAEKVAAGQEAGAALPAARGQDEIATLARAFRRMVEQVHARTRELRESEARIRTILNTAAEGIVAIDQNGRLEAFNLAAERIFGYPAAELRGEHFRKLLYRGKPGDVGSSADDVPALLGTTSLAATGDGSESSLMSISRVNNTTREVVGRRKNGQPFPVEMSVAEVVLGDRLVYTAILRDITDRKQAEAKIHQMTEELEERVRQRTAELVQANQALESARDLALEANRAKDAFLAVMSHELRTPLTAIIGYCDYWLHDEPDENDPAAMRDDLRKILISGRHLLTLINDILDLAKIQAGRMVLEVGEFAVVPLLDELHEWVEPLVRKSANTLAVDAPAGLGSMRSDRVRVRQVLLNLLSNAAKFTNAGSIRLAAARDHDGLVFRVEDTGVGMKPGDVRRLFQPFVQVDSSNTRKHEGTGLGLAICRRLCELMGGTIAVQSAEGVGTTFTVRLPVRVVTPTTSGPPPPGVLAPADGPDAA